MKYTILIELNVAEGNSPQNIYNVLLNMGLCVFPEKDYEIKIANKVQQIKKGDLNKVNSQNVRKSKR